MENNVSKEDLLSNIDHMLQGNRLNDAFRLAADKMPFFLENIDFVKLVYRTLLILGFFKESKKILVFINDFSKYRKTHSEAYSENVLRAKDRGHSLSYESKGKSDEWENPLWKLRAQIIADLIPPNSSVLDLGCGNMLTEQYLNNPTLYIPCDIKQRDERTIVCDFDQFEYPIDQDETQVICIGVVNYLQNQAELLHHICKRNRNFLFSIKPGNLIENKVKQGVFPPALSFDQVVSIISQYSYTVSYQHLMGQGDEILFIGEMRKATLSSSIDTDKSEENEGAAVTKKITDRQSFENGIENLLLAGKLNDAFKLANPKLPFTLENSIFVKLLASSLEQIGFRDEASNVRMFCDRLLNHRADNSAKSTNDEILTKQSGHSSAYKLDGQNNQWENPVWDQRAKYVASLIPEGARVLDMGCGNMLIEKYLRSPEDYFPTDICSRDERTTVCDFDKFEFPNDKGENCIVCLGVINYLHHQKEFLEHILSRNTRFFLTFKPLELIESKVRQGIFPKALAYDQVTSIVDSISPHTTYQFMLGQGEEVLISGTR